MILFLHNRYRTTGGEERAVEDLLWLVRERLGEDAELLERDSSLLGRTEAAAGLLGGGLAPDQVRAGGAADQSARSSTPTTCTPRSAGARWRPPVRPGPAWCFTCISTGSCARWGCASPTAGSALAATDATRPPGVALGCRGSRAEALAYGTSLALWQRRLAAQVDAFVVPSRFALERLHALGAPIGEAHVVAQVVRNFASQSAASAGEHALVTARLAPEKGVDVAIEACRIAGLPLVIAGEGPERARLEARFPGVRIAGQLDEHELASLRSRAVVGLVPSRSGESFGLAAAEAMAAGLPVVASRVGALPELVPREWLVAADDPPAMAAAIGRLRGAPGGRGAGDRAGEGDRRTGDRRAGAGRRVFARNLAKTGLRGVLTTLSPWLQSARSAWAQCRSGAARRSRCRR